MKKKEDFTPNASVVIDGTHVKTYKREIVSANMLEVEVGTTGRMGGDSGHGGRTFFRIKNNGSTDMRLSFCENGQNFKSRDIDDFVLTFGGDCELDTFCEALRIGYNVLSQYSNGSPIDNFMPSPLEQRQERFALYLNELCAHYRKHGNLKGISDIRNKYHITGLTQQQFFECNLDHANGCLPRDFCDSVYAFLLDSTKAVQIPKFGEK